MESSDIKASSGKEALIKRFLEKVESLNNEDIVKILSAVEDTSTAQNTTTANVVKKEPQPSTSYASNKIINEEPLLNTQRNSKKTYDVRVGTTNSGRDYEFKMLTLLCIRCILKKPENMWVATNAKGVGEFDDIVCHIKIKGSPGITYMMQMKHKEAQLEIKREDFMNGDASFNLIKHAKGFSELKETLVKSTRLGDVIENLDPDKILSVFFTNRIAANPGIPYFKECTNEDLMLLNTSGKNKHLYKFNVTAGKALDLTHADYCENIYFLSNQVNETNMDTCIFEETEKLIKQLGLTKINTLNIAKDFIEYVTNRAKSKLKKRQYLTQEQVLHKLTDIFLSEYAVKFNNELGTFRDCSNKKIWQKIVIDKKVTYVAFDIITFKFLKEYVGSEVKKYYDKLMDKYNNENKKSFFHKNSNFEIVLGKQGTPTIWDVYKCMWVDNKIPLLLKINNMEEHRDVLSILNWSKLYFKIMIVKKLELTLPTWLDTKASFVNLNDLNEENQKLILEQSVSLQGRKGHALGELVDKSMYEFIKCDEIIHILTGNYNIGNNYSSVQCFIERSTYKVLIEFEALEEIEDEVFIIQDRAPEGLLINKLEDLRGKSNLIVVQDITKENIEQLRSKYDTIHRLIFYEEDWLEWVESQGKTKHIKEHLVTINYLHSTLDFHDKIRDEVLNKTHVFSGCPGMGKSTLMDFMSNKAPTNMWVLKIALNDHIELYETAQFKKASDHIKYFNEKIINDGSCLNIPLAKAVFQKLLTENKILILLDGFDEVSVSYKDEATKIMKTFHESVRHMWISTRPHMNSHLEDEFDTIAITMTPFTLQDQQNFFVKYFTEFIRNSKTYKRHINKFSQKLLKAADWDREFMEIPLQCTLLADFFIDDLNTSLSQNDITLNEDFNLLQLYEHFMNKKRSILCNKYGKCAKEMHRFFDYYQKLIALKILFRKRDLCELDIDLELSDYYQNKKNYMEFLQRVGVLEVHEEKQMFSATFVHRTFAEFIAAQWLAENYDSTNSKIKNTVELLLRTRFNDDYDHRFLFRIFDSLFAKGFPLHSAIINKQIPQTKNISLGDTNKFDKCKRSILHLIALYFDTNTNYHPTDYKVINNSTAIALDVIETIPGRQMIDLCGKDNFGYNPLDYAILHECTPVVDKLCEKSNEIMVTVGIEGGDRDFLSINRNHYKFAFNKIFQYLVWKCLERDLDDDLAFLSADVTDEGLNYLENLAVKTTTDLIEKLNIKSTSENYYFDLRFAAAFGTVDNVKQLLAEGADVNQRIFGYTSLYCAVKKNRPEIVEILLSEMVELNAICVDGNTALHAACKAGYENLAETLTKSGANINKRNEFGETPLFVASNRNADNIVNLLLQQKAELNIKNYRGNTCLLIAAGKGFYKLVQKFIQYGTDINITNANGRTPLFLALKNRQTDVANLLIKENIKVDITDYYGNSYLHAAAEVGQSDILLYFIQKGLDVNQENDNGETPVQLAQNCRNLNNAKLLYQNGANVNEVEYQRFCVGMEVKRGNNHALYEYLQSGFDFNLKDEHNKTLLFTAFECGNIAAANLLLGNKSEHKTNKKLLLENNIQLDYVDNYGDSYLHAAAKAGEIDIIRLLIEKGLDINKQNEDCETPLFCALQKGHSKAAKFLLDNKAKVDSISSWNKSCLHFAAKLGETDIVHHIIKEDFNINHENNWGETPLSFALKNGHIGVVELLLKNNAKIDGVDWWGNTCLHAAAKTDQSDVVSRLITAGQTKQHR